MSLLYDETTIADLKARMPEYLERVCGVTNLRRPFHCLNPAHEDKHPSMSYDQRANNVKCFSCGYGGDVFNLAGLIEGIRDFPAQVEAVAHAVGYPLPTRTSTTSRKPVTAAQNSAYGKPRALADIDLTDGMQKATRILLEEPRGKAALDYLHGRGFDNDIISDSCIGWVERPSLLIPSARLPHSNADYNIALGFPVPKDATSMSSEGTSNRVTVPYAVFRSCRVNVGLKEFKPSGLIAPLWREDLLTSTCDHDAPVYITEGIFDAMSLTVLLDAQACALCGAGTTRLLEIIAHTPKESRPYLILSFDADEAGARYTATVTKGLSELGITHAIARPYPHGCKDPNELLMLERGCSKSDRESFRRLKGINL